MFIREEPDWFTRANVAYVAYQNSILPCPGGLDQQPAKYMPLMALMQMAAHGEEDFARKVKESQDQLVQESQAQPAPKPRSRRL